MLAPDPVSSVVRLVTGFAIMASLGSCAGELYPEAPTPTRSAAPAGPGAQAWQAVTGQIQSRPTALGNLTFTPFTRSDDPTRVQFLLAVLADDASGTDPLEGGTGTLDLVPPSGPTIRLTLAPAAGSAASSLVTETRLVARQTISVTARLEVQGITLSATFNFTAP